MVLGLRNLDDGELREGFHEVSDEERVRSEFVENVTRCPYGIDGSCEGFKDAEYKERCEVKHPRYLLDCELYRQFVSDPEMFRGKIKVKDVSTQEGNYFQQRDESLHDTVVMSSDEVVRDIKDDASLQDRVDEGEDVSEDINHEGRLAYLGLRHSDL